MSRKKPFTLRSLGKEEAAQANSNFDALFRSRVESLLFYDPSVSGTVVMPFQIEEGGRAFFSGNGAGCGTVARSFPVRSLFSDVVDVQAHAISPNASAVIIAVVTDLTATSITIEARTLSAATAFSSVTSASVSVFWKICGSAP